MVDDVGWAKLADRQEARASQKAALVVARGQEGPHGEAREIVAREEALAGEIAVGVEVGLTAATSLAATEQGELALGLGLAAFRLLVRRAVATAAPVGIRDRTGLDELGLRVVIELPPALACVVEALRRLGHHGTEPHLVEPRARLQRVREGAKHPAALGETRGLLTRTSGTVQALFHLGLEGQVRLPRINQAEHIAPQVKARCPQPDRVDVGLQQIFVGEVNLRGGHGPGDHRRRALEKVLVVAAAGGAVG